MVWRVPRDATPSYEYVAFPWKCPPAEGEIHKAIKAQYCSTYTRDFMGVPQGMTCLVGLVLAMPQWLNKYIQTHMQKQHNIYRHSLLSFVFHPAYLLGHDDIKKAHGQLTPLQSRRSMQVPLPTETKMIVSYREPKQKPQLLAHFHQYSKRDPHVACCGIGTFFSKTTENEHKQQFHSYLFADNCPCVLVPTVVQRHINTQQRGLNLTTYDRFCEKRVSNVKNSLLSQDLQKLHESLPEEG